MRSFLVAGRLGIRVSCVEGRELGEFPNDFPQLPNNKWRRLSRPGCQTELERQTCCRLNRSSRQRNFSFSESLAQDLPPKLLLFKTPLWPPKQARMCSRCVFVWRHANCCGVLGWHLRSWTVDSEQHGGISASRPVSQPLASAVPGTTPFHFLSLFFPLPWRTSFVLDVTQLPSSLWTSMLCRCLVLGDGWAAKNFAHKLKLGKQERLESKAEP